LEPLPIDGEAFVDAVHAQVTWFAGGEAAEVEDQKIVQREVAYLRELRYGKRAPAADDEPPQIIVDMPGPEGTHHEHTEHSTKPVGKVDANGLSRRVLKILGVAGFS